MKTMKYLFISLLVGMFGMNMVEAKSNPTFDISLGVTKVSGSDKMNIETVVKNNATTCDDVGLKSGKVYIYLDDNIIERASNPTGIYKNYNESTGQFRESYVTCSYDGANHRVGCTFGKTVSNPTLIAYSDCKDELIITFETELCAGSDNCDLRVEVEGEAIDYNAGNPTSISNGVKTMSTKNFDCNSKLTSNPTQTPTEPEEDDETVETPDDTPTYEPNENPNTIDDITAYMLIGTLSLVLFVTLITIKKKKLA